MTYYDFKCNHYQVIKVKKWICIGIVLIGLLSILPLAYARRGYVDVVNAQQTVVSDYGTPIVGIIITLLAVGLVVLLRERSLSKEKIVKVS